MRTNHQGTPRRRRGIRLLPALALVAIVPGPADAQIVASERATLTQTISGTELSLDYSRPSARGRTELFGGQLPWGEVWTPGANLNTTLRVSKDVTVGGVELAAGTYGLWIHLVEDGPWQLLVHEDTTLFHTQHPAPDDGRMRVPMERSRGAEFVETLTLDFQRVRADGAVLTLSWGTERATVAIGVDPGVVMTVAEDEAARYTGDWILDQSESLPADSVLAAMRAGVPEADRVFFDAYFETLRVPQEARIRFEDGFLLLEMPVVDAIMAEAQGEGFQTVLLPRAEGIFEPGTLFLGELAFAGGAGLYEFEFDDAGRAISFVVRDPSDEIGGHGTRAGGG